MGKIDELESIFFFDKQNKQIGSIFIEDPSLSFDYAHISTNGGKMLHHSWAHINHNDRNNRRNEE